MQHFTYIWFDKTRKMFYIGTHSGHTDDTYVSSSRWFTGEVKYRPDDFKRRVLNFYSSKIQARKAEAKLLSYIQEHEFGTKYYNQKNGRKKGTPASNKGLPCSHEQKQKISAALQGRTFSDSHKENLSKSHKSRKPVG